MKVSNLQNLHFICGSMHLHKQIFRYLSIVRTHSLVWLKNLLYWFCHDDCWCWFITICIEFRPRSEFTFANQEKNFLLTVRILRNYEFKIEILGYENDKKYFVDIDSICDLYEIEQYFIRCLFWLVPVSTLSN